MRILDGAVIDGTTATTPGGGVWELRDFEFAGYARDAAARTRAGTKPHGAFKVQFLRAQRGAGVLLPISSKFWLRSSPVARAPRRPVALP